MGGGICVDIGMNIGNHTIFLASHGLEVIGFEANPYVFKIAEKNVEINQLENKVQIYNYGISSKDETMSFRKNISSNLGGMSLKQNRNGNIQCKSLDSFNIDKKISLMKIDVEGMELEVLKGSKKLLERDKPDIFLESNEILHFFGVKNFLENLGYIHQNIIGEFGALIHIFTHESKINKEILEQNLLKNFSLPFLHSILSNRYFYRKIKQVRNIAYGVLGLSAISIILNLILLLTKS